MLYLVLKFFLSALIIVVVSEVAKRSGVFGALIASLPLTSLLAIIWLYLDTGDTQKVSELSSGILWLVLPSLIFFVLLPILLKAHVNFWLAMLIASACTSGAYLGTFGLIRWMRGA